MCWSICSPLLWVDEIVKAALHEGEMLAVLVADSFDGSG